VRQSHRHSAYSRPVSAGLRALAAFLALCVVALNVWPALHHAIVEHVACAEHGTLEHAHAHGAQAPDEPGDQGRPGARAQTPASDDHERCGVPLAISERAIQPASMPSVDGTPAADRAAAPSGEHGAKGGIPRLSLAPKLSPPA
jgi:hypothetical protein